MMNIAADDKVTAAARYLSEQSERVPHVVRVIKETFDLSALQACEACALAADIRQSSGARN